MYIIIFRIIAFYILIFFNNNNNVKSENCLNSCSGHGICENNKCACFDGWQGSHCQFCGGKISLKNQSGEIYASIGNYTDNMKCTWIINAPNSSITLHFKEYITECGWDHLYIYDGDGVHSPLLATFSGIMYKRGHGVRRVPEVVAKSGSALLHFSSDAAMNMTGFKLIYRLNPCPTKTFNTECSGNGICTDGVCICNKLWSGLACELPKCPGNCNVEQGRGYCEPEIERCSCAPGFVGVGCSQSTAFGSWETIKPAGLSPAGSASHGAVVYKNALYIVGGHTYKQEQAIYKYKFADNVWTVQDTNNITKPSARYGHSAVVYEDKLFVYGGSLNTGGSTSELWTFDFQSAIWENVTAQIDPCFKNVCSPLRSAGHTATVVSDLYNKKLDRMVIIFGYSPEWGYHNIVQEFSFSTREWQFVNTSGFPVVGSFGHSSSWDSLTQKIYVYGGIITNSEFGEIASSSLYSYDPYKKTWKYHANIIPGRFLHSATFVSPGLMMIFGGNMFSSNECYSSDALLYDVVCNNWQQLSIPLENETDLARFGHATVKFEGSLYVYGGFNGQMLSDILKYTPGYCEHLNNSHLCLTAKPGVKCVWNHLTSKCVSLASLGATQVLAAPDKLQGVISKCLEQNNSSIHYTDTCSTFTSCTSCVQTAINCVWCDNICSKTCGTGESITAASKCPIDLATSCQHLYTCRACTSNANCNWNYEKGCRFRSSGIQESKNCKMACSALKSCLNCTQNDCIWCQNKNSCVDRNAYISSFPYGQCREYTVDEKKCLSHTEQASSSCSFYNTCTQCQEHPACGWCDDGSGTGTGQCVAGGHARSFTSGICSSDRWYFAECPGCQCNGHAKCLSNSSVCETCQNWTTGRQCEQCIPGYWGYPVNGGRCKPCDCNRRATQCDPDTGKCYCTTKGTIGDRCDKCDERNMYSEHPTKGYCYYNLFVNYLYTFNISKTTDKHFTQINFGSVTPEVDEDMKFTIVCSVPAKMNVTLTNDNLEEPLIEDKYCNATFSTWFNTFNLQNSNSTSTYITFDVSVYDFKTPLWIQISFSQYKTLDSLISRGLRLT